MSAGQARRELGTTDQSREDKAWLLWDLRHRMRECKARATKPSRDRFMGVVDWHSHDRFERLIAMVREIQP